MNTVNARQRIAEQHQGLRTILEHFEAVKDLPISSDLATDLLSRLMESLIGHFNIERKLIELIGVSADQAQAHAIHGSQVLNELTDLEFELMSRNTSSAPPIAHFLPQMRSWVSGHERLDVHSAFEGH